LVNLVEAGGEQPVEHLSLDLAEKSATLWRPDALRQRLAKPAFGRLAELARGRLDLSLNVEPDAAEHRPARVRDLTGVLFDLFSNAVAERGHGANARQRRLARAEPGKRQPPREREEDVLQRGRDELADEDGIDRRARPARGWRRCSGDDLAESSADLFRKGFSER